MPERSLALLVAAIAALALAACGGGSGDGATAADTPATAVAPADTPTTAVTATGETTPEATDGGAQAGAVVFESAGCGGCHTLAAAGSTGNVGPNLDELRPELDDVVEQVTNGGGAMPAFGETLSETQIRDVAAYVVQSTSEAGAETESEDDSSGGGYG